VTFNEETADLGYRFVNRSKSGYEYVSEKGIEKIDENSYIQSKVYSVK
jgi:hypothetical protein